MDYHIETYDAKDECVTLHTWIVMEGSKKENLYIKGVPGTPMPLWFRDVLRKRALGDLTDFPSCV